MKKMLVLPILSQRILKTIYFSFLAIDLRVCWHCVDWPRGEGSLPGTDKPQTFS